MAMFGATFVFPLVMGLDPNLAIMMSGVATILFLLITRQPGAELPRDQRVVRRAAFAIRGRGDRAACHGAIWSPGWCSPRSASW